MYSLLNNTVRLELDENLNPSVIEVGGRQIDWQALISAMLDLRSQLIAAHPDMVSDASPPEPQISAVALEIAFNLLAESSALVGLLRQQR